MAKSILTFLRLVYGHKRYSTDLPGLFHPPQIASRTGFRWDSFFDVRPCPCRQPYFSLSSFSLSCSPFSLSFGVFFYLALKYTSFLLSIGVSFPFSSSVSHSGFSTFISSIQNVFQNSNITFLFLQILDEMVAWNINSHVMGMH